MSLDIIELPRSGGKTVHLVEWFLEDIENRGIISESKAESDNLWDYVRKGPMAGEFVPRDAFIAFGERPRGYHRQWAIDNLDACLRRIYPDLGPLTVTTDGP